MSENSKGQLYEYAVLYHPKRKERDAPRKRSEIIVDLKRVLATTEQEAAILAAREIPEGYLDKLPEVEIVIRPF